jgi:serine/threonine-protein kinase
VDQDPTNSGAPAEGAATLDLSGRCVGSSYILIRPIGQGATGVVWRGVDRASGDQVAVKLLHESLLRQPKLVTRFVQERTILLMLRHRNVVRVRDLFSVGESLGLVMDLVPGGSLRDHLRKQHTVPAGEAARLAAQVAAALAEAHELGIVHRDLKPDNILLQTEDGRLDTRLTDFGIARVLNTPALTTPNAVVGTPHYMSPEAFHGATASPAADVYALGVLLYELVTGRPPYDSDSVPDLMRRHLEGNPERLPGIPDELWTVIMSCLAQKPRLRPSAAELVADLGDVALATAAAPALPPPPPRAGPPPVEPGSKHPSAVVPPPRAPVRRNQVPKWRWARPGPWAALIGGAMVASAVATTAWHLSRADGDPSGPVVGQHAASTPAVRRANPPPSAPAGKVASAPPAAAGHRARGDLPAATAHPIPVRATTVPNHRPKPPVVQEKAYGPVQCKSIFAFSFSTPILAQPCFNVGSKVQIRAQITAPAGGRATVSVALQDASTGRTAATPHTCSSLVFTENFKQLQCGPTTVNPAHGHRYVVVISWQYTRGSQPANGTARGDDFAW